MAGTGRMRRTLPGLRAMMVALVLATTACGGGPSHPAIPTTTTGPSDPGNHTTTTRPSSSTPDGSALHSPTAAVPRPDHIVLVMLENKNYRSITGSPDAPYLNSLAAQGMRFDNAFAVAHPSQPNYVAIISGSTQGVSDDACPRNFHGVENLPHQLIAAGLSFTGYSEDLPSPGFTGCSAGRYARKHNGWVDFDNVPAASNQPFTAFPSDFAALPTFTYVVPNLCNDMHDCSVRTGDSWVRDHLGAYARWAQSHNSLLIVTLDEDGGSEGNRIFTTFVGEQVRIGTSGRRIDHYSVLRTIDDAFGLRALGNAAQAAPITDVWR